MLAPPDGLGNLGSRERNLFPLFGGFGSAVRIAEGLQKACIAEGSSRRLPARNRSVDRHYFSCVSNLSSHNSKESYTYREKSGFFALREEHKKGKPGRDAALLQRTMTSWGLGTVRLLEPS